MKRTIFSFALLLGLSGCAQPKYETAGSSGVAGQGAQGQGSIDCSLRFRTSTYCVSWQWVESPTNTKAGSLVFKVSRPNLFDSSPVPTDLASLPSVVLWMPSMGHGSSPTSVSRLDQGTYRASDVFFIMPGEWEIRFQVKDGASVVDEAIATLTI